MPNQATKLPPSPEATCSASSETPETDAAFDESTEANDTLTDLCHRLGKLCAKMEREKTAYRKAIESAIIELVPPARPSVCRRVLREALGQDPTQIYNSSPNETSAAAGSERNAHE